MDTVTSRIPFNTDLKPELQQYNPSFSFPDVHLFALTRYEKKHSVDLTEKSGHMPSVRGPSSFSIKGENERQRADKILQNSTNPKSRLIRLDPVSTPNNVHTPWKPSISGDSETAAYKRTKMPQIPPSRKGSFSSNIKIAMDIPKNEVSSPVRNIPQDRSDKSSTTNAIIRKLESLNGSPSMRKYYSAPAQEVDSIKALPEEYTFKPNDIQSQKRSLPQENKIIGQDGGEALSSFRSKIIALDRGQSRAKNSKEQEEEQKKKSSLKARFIEAKSQEEELGRKLSSLHNGRKRRILADVLDKRNETNAASKEDLESPAMNLRLSQKYESPAIYELKRKKIARELDLEGEFNRQSNLEETIKDELDGSIAHSSIIMTSRTNRGIVDISFSAFNSYSTSESKESIEKHKSSSLDRSCSFILRNDTNVRKSLRLSLSVNQSSNDSNASSHSTKNKTKRSTVTTVKAEEQLEIVQTVSKGSIEKPPKAQKPSPSHQTKFEQAPNAVITLFPLNNNRISPAPSRKGSYNSQNEFQPIEEDAAEEKNSHSARSSISDVAKKETKFGQIIKWKIGNFIGSGSYGQVYKAMEMDTGRIIAVKKIPFTNTISGNVIGDIDSELSILSKLKHENIVQYLGHENINNTLYIYMEHVAGGSLPSIYGRYGALHEKTIKVYAKQILLGLHYLHENGVIHKDIKGANILIHKDGTVKLSDFGCSSEIERTLTVQNPMQNGLKGSVPWMAPEVVKETGFGRRSDIWSFGCTILEMATAKAPWSQYDFDNHITLMMKVALTDEIPAIPEKLNQDLKDFIRCCLKRDQDERPHAIDLLAHKFLTE